MGNRIRRARISAPVALAVLLILCLVLLPRGIEEEGSSGPGDQSAETTSVDGAGGPLDADACAVHVMDDQGECEKPHPGMIIRRSTSLCSGVYDMRGGSPAVQIAESDVRLHCIDTVLDGGGERAGVGIRLAPGVTNVEMSGCVLEGFDTGILGINAGSGSVIYDVSINRAGNSFIRFEGVDGFSICQSRFVESAGTGITCSDCSNGMIANNYYLNSSPVMESPIAIVNSHSMRIEDNEIRSLGGAACNGIWLYDSDDNLVKGNYIEVKSVDRGADGSHLENSSYNRLMNNTYVVDPGSEILEFLRGSRRNAFSGNKFIGGVVNDTGGLDTIWCVDGAGNEYLNGASYSGNDAHRGACPRMR